MRHKSGTPGQCGVIDGLRHQRAGVTLFPTSLVSDQWAYCPDDRATAAGEGLSSADRVICSPRVQGAVTVPCNVQYCRRLPAAPSPRPRCGGAVVWGCLCGVSGERHPGGAGGATLLSVFVVIPRAPSLSSACSLVSPIWAYIIVTWWPDGRTDE